MGSHNQITYLYFCTLGGLAHPRTAKRQMWNGIHYYETYHLL
jgi:hypothetical protein